MFRDRCSKILAYAILPLSSLLSYGLLDRRIAYLCAEIPDSVIDVLGPITDFGRSQGYLIGGALAALVFRFVLKQPRLLTAAVLLVSSVALSGIATNVLKLLVGRSRPYNLLRHDEYGFVPFKIDYAYNAFPSGHTATVVAVALSLSFAFPRWRIPLFSVGAVVASTRILMNHHFLSDVIMGMVLAIAITSTMARWTSCRTWGLAGMITDLDEWPARSLPGYRSARGPDSRGRGRLTRRPDRRPAADRAARGTGQAAGSAPDSRGGSR
ncbi:phosphatase PAP2 family protein [bacterium]|nr:phosphatase PAP2 family protein [bacterium]MBU1073526.1 phosphatase PAP2 family protein [bacterium]MBU1676418.1 phosphatase PAP2 family protein [bacterium]